MPESYPVMVEVRDLFDYPPVPQPGESERERHLCARVQRMLHGLHHTDALYVCTVLLKDLVDREYLDYGMFSFEDHKTIIGRLGVMAPLMRPAAPDEPPPRFYNLLQEQVEGGEEA